MRSHFRAAIAVMLLTALAMPCTALAAMEHRTNTLGMGFRILPAGTVTMGPDFFGGDFTCRARLSSFALAETHTPWGVFARVRTWALDRGYRFSAPGQAGSHPADPPDPKQPVVKVPWVDAVAWCNALSEYEGRSPAYRTAAGTYRGGMVELATGHVDWRGPGYRLPTEAEMVYAIKAGTANRWFWGDGREPAGDHAWFMDNSGGTTHPVATRKPNPWGLFDMVGNVSTLCWDWYADYPRGDFENPTGPGEGVYLELRGGHFGSQVFDLESDYRSDLAGRKTAKDVIGFRTVLPRW